MRRLHRNPDAAPAAAWGKTRPAGRRRDGRLHRNAGAALIVALSIMAVLLAVGLTFFAVTRIESTTAVNVVHTVRAQYLVDAGFAVAQHTLNRDLQVNPNATSTDHAWRTLFNGAAFIGKEWTWVDGIAPWDGGRTAFTLEGVERALRDAGLLAGGLLYAQFYLGDGDAASAALTTPDGPREPLFRGPRTAPWLAVPRWSGQTILLYATEKDMRLTTAAGDRLTLTDINNALSAAGLPQRFERFDMSKNTLFPFVTPDFAGQVRVERNDGTFFIPFAPGPGSEVFPANFVDLWADFDSDGDGLRDSVWIPLPKDADLSRDGLDNDLDGYADNQYLNPAVAAQGLAATDDGEIRRNFELGAFVYAVDPSGAVIRDQDPDNPAAVAGYRLTLPLPGLSVPVDMDRDGEITPADRRLNPANGALEYVYLTLPGQLSVPGVPVSLTMRDVDSVDNDFDLTVNGFTAYAAPGPEFITLKDDGTYDCPPVSVPALTEKGLRPLNLDVVAAAFSLSNTALSTYHDVPVRRPDGTPTGATCTCPAFVLGVSAESVCEVIGRMAVHIADESGKANLNNAGLHTYGHKDVLEASALTSVERAARVVRGMNQALSPAEYETRILPGMGVQHSAEAWNMLMGAGTKVASASNDNLWDFESLLNPAGSVVVPQPYDYDVTLPGLGRADDNANSFLLAFSRRDENASGLPDSGLYLPRLSEWSKLQLSASPPATAPLLWTDDVLNSRTPAYYGALGLLEGIDDPAEFLQRAPLRNRLAESDGNDNNNNQTVDELGELGDRTLAVHYELQKMADAGPKRAFGADEWPDINRFITANSEARNVFYVSTPYGDRAVNKLDPNYATVSQLAAALLLRGRFPNAAGEITAPGLAPGSAGALFAFGLRQSNKTLRGALFGGGNPSAAGAVPGLFPADGQLQALQTAVNVVDRRDRDAVRSLLVLEKRSTASLQYEPAEPLNERERVRQQDLFPAGAVQEYLSDAFGLTPDTGDITAVDPWWAAVTNAGGQVQNRLLSYAAAGAEAIRITEIMPRPVRRVEAEILPLADQALYQIDPATKIPGASANWTAANIPAFNLNPAPYTEMPPFDMARTTVPEEQDRLYGAAGGASSWTLQSSYGVDATSGDPVTALGTANAWVYTPPAGAGWTASVDDPANPGNADVLEFRFRATNGLPPGRYYLTLNVQMPAPFGTGFMTVDGFGAQDVLDYSVKYIPEDDPATPEPEDLGQAADVARILALPDTYVDGGGNTVDLTAERFRLLQAYFRANFQTVDEAEFIANEAARLSGSGMPTGWVFAPARDRTDTVNAADYTLITDYLEFVLPASSASFFDSLNTAYFLDGVVAGDTPSTRTLTVIVPPVPTVPGTPATLCVAVRMRPLAQNVLLLDPDTGAPIIDPDTLLPIPRYLSVNFFDFSQEPDHEYVEIANTTDQELDLSGWTLEVGIPDPAGLDTNPEMRDPFKSVWEVPRNTRIAANGRLLLTFTDQQGTAKLPPLDTYRDTTSTDPDFATPRDNGIGMASLVGDPATDMVTVPPIADGSADAAYLDIQDADGTGSVFRRTATDYIDNDGDGVSSQNRYFADNAAVDLDTDRVLEEIRTYDVTGTGVVPAFARIVPLVNRRLWEDAPYTDAALPISLADIVTVKRVAQLVLRGGVLPNYPERDGYDNDGDGGYIAKDSAGLDLTPDGAILRRYIRGTLDKDMVDNDFNGLLDENGAEYYDNDPAVLAWIHATPLLSEGVDEGRLFMPPEVAGFRPRVLGPGSFERTPFKIAFMTNVFYHKNFLDSSVGSNPAYRNGVDDLTSYNFYNVPGVAATDSPEWAAFAERRWNPGDNVIVTLYVGDSTFGRVADQATYREYDVVNRAVDDIVESPYYVDGYNNYDLNGAWLGAGGAALQNRVALSPDRLSYWPPDQMGLDFYRALERKHPLYAGDRFGVSNRWEPTDGAYDDWADSPGWYEQVYVPDGSGGMVPGIEPRFGLDTGYTAGTPKDHATRLFGHAMAGSPLRMNLTERLWENPPDLVARLLGNTGPENTGAMRTWDADGTVENTPGKLRQFPENDELQFPGDTTNAVYGSHAHAFRRAGPDNVPYATLADLMRVPMPLFEHSLDNTFRIPSSHVNTRYQPGNYSPYEPALQNLPPGNSAGAVWRQDLSLRAAILGNAAPLSPHRPLPMRARMAGLADLTEMSALDPIVLTVGNAGFAPLWPNPAQTGLFGIAATDDDLSLLYAQWQDDGNPDTPAVPPFYWSPVYLFADGNEAGFAYSPFPVFGELNSGAARYTGLPAQLTAPSGGWRWPVLLNRAFLADWNRPAPVFGTMVPNTGDPETRDMTLVERRWPTARRAAMFVSRYDTAAGEANRPEMILTWDADDGLVNGTYIVYVGTFVPGMADQLGRLQEVVTGLSADGAAALLNSPTAPVLTEPPLPLDSTGSVLEPRLAGLLSLDANRDQGSGDRFDPLLALEFVTDRTTASRVAPPQPPLAANLTPEERERIRLGALTHPQDWYPPDPVAGGVPSGVAYRADGDGMILYSHDAALAWRPRLVRVTDNFLALRVRNLGRPDQVACITCVVLTPAPRTYGRLNVNTAETGRFQEGGGTYLFNPLLGLPGIVKAYDTMAGVSQTGAPRALDALALPSLAYLAAQGVDLPPLGYTPNPALGNPLLHQLDPDPAVDGAWDAPHEGLASLRLLSLLVSQRPHHPDGRYFTALASLAAGAGEDGILGNESGVLPVRPLSNYRHAAPRFDEIYQRFAGLANLVETRSDMFEILVTVQEGNLSDLDGDGRLDYRGRMNSEEFVKTAESAGRAIYERRARKDASEEARGVR